MQIRFSPWNCRENDKEWFCFVLWAIQTKTNLPTNWTLCSRTVKTKIHNFAKLPSRKFQHLWTQKLLFGWRKRLRAVKQRWIVFTKENEVSKKSYQILEIVQNKSPKLRRPQIYMFFIAITAGVKTARDNYCTASIQLIMKFRTIIIFVVFSLIVTISLYLFFLIKQTFHLWIHGYLRCL